jgi:hypothetical protein
VVCAPRDERKRGAMGRLRVRRGRRGWERCVQLRVCVAVDRCRVGRGGDGGVRASLVLLEFSIFKNHGAQAWANALPVSLLKLTNMEMHVSISLSLGIPPYFYSNSKGYAPIKCKHASVSTSCNNVDLRTDLNHALSCPFERKRGTNTRHNKVQSLLEEFANQCNARVTHPQDLSMGLEHSSERLDFVVEFFRDAVGVDVTCVNPTAKSYHAVNKNDHTTASKNAYLDKMKKYASLSVANDLPILPFVAETYGGIYHKSRQLLSKMADQMPSGLYAGNRLASKHYYTTAITVSIMRENARIITRAHQHAAIT